MCRAAAILLASFSVLLVTCNGGVRTCTFWFHFDLDVDAFPVSGLQEIRFRSTVQERSPSGAREEMRCSLNFQVVVANGMPRSDVTRYPYLRGKGWYTGPAYCEAALLNKIPDGPRSGVWRHTYGWMTTTVAPPATPR